MQYWGFLQFGSRIISIWFETYRKLPWYLCWGPTAPEKEQIWFWKYAFPSHIRGLQQCLGANSLIFSAVWMYQRWQTFTENKLLGLHQVCSGQVQSFCTEHTSSGLSQRSSFSQSYLLTPKPEAQSLITAAEKPVLFSLSRTTRRKRPASRKGRVGCLLHLERTETEKLSRECTGHTQ